MGAGIAASPHCAKSGSPRCATDDPFSGIHAGPLSNDLAPQGVRLRTSRGGRFREAFASVVVDCPAAATFKEASLSSRGVVAAKAPLVSAQRFSAAADAFMACRVAQRPKRGSCPVDNGDIGEKRRIVQTCVRQPGKASVDERKWGLASLPAPTAPGPVIFALRRWPRIPGVLPLPLRLNAPAGAWACYDPHRVSALAFAWRRFIACPDLCFRMAFPKNYRSFTMACLCSLALRFRRAPCFDTQRFPRRAESRNARNHTFGLWITGISGISRSFERLRARCHSRAAGASRLARFCAESFQAAPDGLLQRLVDENGQLAVPERESGLAVAAPAPSRTANARRKSASWDHLIF